MVFTFYIIIACVCLAELLVIQYHTLDDNWFIILFSV